MVLNASLFLATVLIWGTTWVAIAFQIGPVPLAVSVFYRFALAALVMLAGLALNGRLRRPTVWRYVVLQALCLYCFNFICLYHATAYIPSGLVSVIFSLASIFNAVNGRMFYKDRIGGRAPLAGAIGVGGLLLVFWDQLSLTMDAGTLKGIGWAVLGTLFFSWGAMASRRNSAEGVSPMIANAWGMGIGAGLLLAIVLLTNQPLAAPPDAVYWGALLYLAVIGSVVGFTLYLTLVSRIGAVEAGYATVLFPIVALTASTLFEGYQWTETAVVGVILTGLGNIVMFVRTRPNDAHRRGV